MFRFRHGRRQLVVTLLVALAALTACTEAHAWGIGTLVGDYKDKLKAGPAVSLAVKGFRNAPAVTVVAGWNFGSRNWGLNEFTNQLVHLSIGSVTNRISGRKGTFCLAVGLEVWQYFINDNQDAKLADRIRDVAFYLLP
ncbi:MAG: hypothetical protein GWP08_16850 [Nitrospiraceae bacterium]|nr:hypothetical protein [Nitrospiraceae bacterium]